MYTDDVTHRLVAVTVPSGTCMATLVGPGPSTPPTGHGVLVVPALGIEHAGSDRLVRLFGDHAARLGHLVLIIEPVGTGDSTDLPDDTDLVVAYGQAITAGIRELARLGTHVTLMGLRFGALAIATSLAADPCVREMVLGAVLIEPVEKGRNYRRELLMLGASTSDGLDDGWAAPAGSVLRPSDLAALHGLMLDDTPPPAGHVLLAYGNDTALPASLTTSWSSTATVETLRIAFDQIVVEDPERGRPLIELIVGVTEWLSLLPDVAIGATSLKEPPPDFRAAGTTWSEDVVALPMDDGEVLRGVRTLPKSTTRAGLVILSTGTNPRFGPGRLHTVLARRLAALGVATLRIERRGAGSDGRAVDAYNPIHISDAHSIDAAASDVLHTSDFAIAGMCSGSWATWHALLGGVRAGKVLLMNQIIFGEDSWDLSEDSPAMAVKTRQSLGDLDRWRAILRGEIRMVRSVRNLARYAALTARHRFGGLSGLRADLETIAHLDTDVHFMFDDAESGLVYLNMHGNEKLTQLIAERRITVDVVRHAGHVFASPQSVNWLFENVARHLGLTAANATPHDKAPRKHSRHRG